MMSCENALESGFNRHVNMAWGPRRQLNLSNCALAHWTHPMRIWGNSMKSLVSAPQTCFLTECINDSMSNTLQRFMHLEMRGLIHLYAQVDNTRDGLDAGESPSQLTQEPAAVAGRVLGRHVSCGETNHSLVSLVCTLLSLLAQFNSELGLCWNYYRNAILV